MRSKAVKLSELPDQSDADAVFEFAMSFDGYEHFRSFDASAQAAASGDKSSLDLIRNELFFAARASRHRGDDAYINTYRQLLPLLRDHASAD